MVVFRRRRLDFYAVSDKTIHIKFPVTPRGQQRARHGRNGTYTPAATRAATDDLRTVWMLNGRPAVPGATFFRASIVATYQRPATTKLAYPRRSDVDNIAKLVLDAMQGHAFDNDTFCREVIVSKEWGQRDCLTLTLSWE